jgi:hypothetical protein
LRTKWSKCINLCSPGSGPRLATCSIIKKIIHARFIQKKTSCMQNAPLHPLLIMFSSSIVLRLCDDRTRTYVETTGLRSNKSMSQRFTIRFFPIVTAAHHRQETNTTTKKRKRLGLRVGPSCRLHTDIHHHTAW